MPVIQFSGLASGIDSKALIDALIDARSQTNKLRQNDIDFLNSENDALDELNTKILALSDLIDQFRTVNGGGVSKRSTSSDTTVASATVGSSAINSSFSLTVGATASSAQASFDDVYTGSTDELAPNAVGSQNIQVDVGSGADQVSVTVAITNTTTVQGFVDAFNVATNAEGRVAASLVNVGTTSSPSYRVAFNTLQSGRDRGDIAFTIPNGATGFGGAGDLQTRTVSQATNASFSVSGIAGSITRSTNSVSDVISGVTLNLVKSGTATITIGNDADSTADDMEAIINSFNEIVDYINKHDTIERVESGEDATNVFGTLAKTRVDNDLLSQFRTNLSAASSTSGTSVFAFSDLGIATNRDGTIEFDREAFVAAVGDDAAGAAEVLRDFADSVGGVDGTLYQYTKFAGFIDIAQNANNTEIQTLNDAISALERSNKTYRESLEKTFSRLESVSGKLQGQQSALTSALASLG